MTIKRLLYFILSTCLIAGIFIAYNYYSPVTLKKPYLLPQNRNDTINIAYIGDSWAFMHNRHKCLIPELLNKKLHIPVAIYTYGVCGLTSKEIYYNIFENDSLRNFLMERSYQYCFVAAGINDTYKKMSISYYQKSMDAIIYFFQTNNIRPIILGVPDYDIWKSYHRQTTTRKLLRKISTHINHTPIDCRNQFRVALYELINQKDLNGKVDIIDHQEWNNNYDQDLNELYLEDGLHLNNRGYDILDSVIAIKISNHLRQKHTTSQESHSYFTPKR